ncbi:MAG: MoxR family ATPase [Acidobacteriota bacterium]
MAVADDPFTLFHGDGKVHPRERFPPAPPWRLFDAEPIERPPAINPPRTRPPFLVDEPEIDLVNAALHLRRPLLITGKPGVGKSSLIHAVAHELQLGEVLVWPINTRSTLEAGLYRYDAIGRLQEENLRKERGQTVTKDDGDEVLGKYIKLGPLGTAFLPSNRPRALLIDEIDKSDIDLPNDLLNIFEEGSFEIPVLSRVSDFWPTVRVQAFDGKDKVPVSEGRVAVREFPFIVMTSNGERDFPQPFLRRCIRMQIEPPGFKRLADIVEAHLPESGETAKALIDDFLRLLGERDLATDQLLNAVFLATSIPIDLGAKTREKLRESLFQSLSGHGNR